MRAFSLLLIAFIFCALPCFAASRGGVSDVMLSKPAVRKVSVFFAGNSYTGDNDMPAMVVALASSDPGNPVQLEAQSATKSGGNLQTLYDDTRARAAFTARKWDFIVLQEHSLWPVLPENVETATETARRWAELAKTAGARPVLFQLWPRQPGSFWYYDHKYAYLGSARKMSDKIAMNTNELAIALHAVIAPVGSAWAAALKDSAEWPLYAADSHHPTLTGSFLTALVMYQTLTGRSAMDTNYVPKGISPASAAALRRIAATVRAQ